MRWFYKTQLGNVVLFVFAVLLLTVVPAVFASATEVGLKPVAVTYKMTAYERKIYTRAQPYFPMLKQILAEEWSDIPVGTFIPAQIEQESLWNPRAELKTSREYGFGFGQFTITSRFNAFEEVKVQHPKLKSWTYEERFDPNRQMLAVIVKDKGLYRSCVNLMASPDEAMNCVASSYNGGLGGFQADRRVCSNTKGCNPRLWFGHIEHTSLKSKTIVPGYGKPFFYINREYVDNIRNIRSKKYVNEFGNLELNN